jgi:signal transduction histidine kinase
MRRALPTPLPLTSRLSRLLLPLAVAVAVITALAAPLTWFFLSYRELQKGGADYASFLASQVGTLATESPDLWKYATPKIAGQVRSSLGVAPAGRVLVVDSLGRQAFAEGTEHGPMAWSSVHIPAAGADVGTVVVGVSCARLLKTGTLLVLLFAVVGGLAGFLLFRVPLKSLGTAEEHLNRAVEELAAARDALESANAQLEERVRAKTASLQEAHRRLEDHQEALQTMAARMLSVQEEERQRIARDLHDTAGQILTAVRLNLEVLRGQLAAARGGAAPQPGTPPAIAAETAALADRATEAIRSAIHALDAPLEQAGGLARALRDVALQFGQADLSVRVASADIPPGSVPAAVEICLWRVAQEAVNNAVKHSNARDVVVSAGLSGASAWVEVVDDGDGNPSAIVPGVGLRSMNERVTLLRGHLSITAGEPRGLKVRADIPVPRNDGTG